jgi:hypothetical protein
MQARVFKTFSPFRNYSCPFRPAAFSTAKNPDGFFSCFGSDDAQQLEVSKVHRPEKREDPLGLRSPTGRQTWRKRRNSSEFLRIIQMCLIVLHACGLQHIEETFGFFSCLGSDDPQHKKGKNTQQHQKRATHIMAPEFFGAIR